MDVRHRWMARGLLLAGAWCALTIAPLFQSTPVAAESPPASAPAAIPFESLGTEDDAITATINSSVDWGDYDNDGDLDLVVTGQAPNEVRIAKVYRNNNGVFEDIGSADDVLQGVHEGSSSWGDYDNDGDLDLLITGADNLNAPTANIYRNDNGTFVDSGAADTELSGVIRSDAQWGDYDNDGDLDILLAGSRAGVRVAYIHSNDDGIFSKSGAADDLFAGSDFSSIAWVDYDNDGDLDVNIAGRISGGGIFRLYENVGGTFVDGGADDDAVPQLAAGSVAWGDYDGDGDPDLLITGVRFSDVQAFSQIFRNNNGILEEVGSADDALIGVYNGSSGNWGDYDNDGDLDILLTGDRTPRSYYAGLYRNNNGVFEEVSVPTDLASAAVRFGESVWGDYDADNDLDILASGQGPGGTNGLGYTTILRNTSAITNTPPSAPISLTTTIISDTAIFAWAAATDTQTVSPTLTYNLRVGTTPGGNEIVSAQAITTGRRMVPAMGNAQHGLSMTLDLSIGARYYWSVQAIDTSWIGSAFAPEQTFIIQRACATDLNGDGVITVADIQAVASHWGEQPPSNPLYDLDIDQDVDATDILLVAEDWGESCP